MHKVKQFRSLHLLVYIRKYWLWEEIKEPSIEFCPGYSGCIVIWTCGKKDIKSDLIA